MSLLRTNLKKPIALAVAALTLGMASPAFGEEEESLVPPGNSAVNQYTESYPTTRGNKTIRAPRGSGGQQKERTPQEVLGSRNSKRLEQQGSDGQAVAELATETAPATSASGGGGGGQGASATGTPGDAGSGTAQGSGQTKAAGGNSGAPADSARSDAGGSSAFGEVIGEATGSSSSDGLGIVLPLLILAAVLWALLYAWRHRRHQVS
jgi:cobalamin biosynthesis Mg chelatase CobN